MQVIVIILLLVSLVMGSNSAPVSSENSDKASVQQSEVLRDLFEYTNKLKAQGLIKETPEQKGKYFFDLYPAKCVLYRVYHFFFILVHNLIIPTLIV